MKDVTGLKVMKKGTSLFFMAFMTFMSFTFALSCSSPRHEAGPLQITLRQIDAKPGTSAAGSSAIVVSGLSGAELQSLRSARWDDAAWQALLRVSVTGNEAAVAGRYVVTSEAVQFEPRFPFDPGRSYSVRLDPSKLPTPRDARVLEEAVALPAKVTSPTVVTAIYPSANVWPENILRFYIHFSAPMSATGGLDFVRLIDDAGQEVPEAFLVLDTDLWNDDYMRCTVFFDPGRVKRGVGPNLQLGRAIREGRRYAIVVNAAWPDAHGHPLKASSRHELRAGPPVERALSVTDWRVVPPANDTRDPLTVTFPWPLDRALLMRAVGVVFPDGRSVDGSIAVEQGETIWKFTPRDPWRAGDYQLAVLTLLEDPSGNRVGRAFEVEMFERGARMPQQERVTVPFKIR
jgi:hypothetical protein